jgi:hypothetical protein
MKRRCRRRKLPRVMRLTAATAWASVEVVEVEGEAESFPVAGQDEGEFFVAEGLVAVREPDPAVELRVGGESLLEAGHADQEKAEGAAVESVAEVFEFVGGESFCFVDDK